MHHMRLYNVAIALLLFVASCSQPRDVTLTRTSPDSKTHLTITGKKASALDPFQVTLAVKSGDIPEGSLNFEVAADDLNDTNVRVDWSDAQHAVITFTQRDGEPRIFTLSVSDTGVILAPAGL